MHSSLIETKSTDPYYNLALERYLLENVESDEVILYLWQNENTVVIGRNQSALSECRIQELEKAGGHLARRLSGGGAVYHDLGNLNFTFLAPRDLYDEKRQTGVILDAIRLLGVECERTGRNDLLACGHKFSGHAYYHSNTNSYHHGTLLVDVDLESMTKFLNPSPLKLASKGVASVKSRVCNLHDLNSAIDVDAVKRAMVEAFEREYCKSNRYNLESSATSLIEKYRSEFSSRQWLLKNEVALQNSFEERFEWGSLRIDFDVEGERITNVALYSDGLDADILDELPRYLSGCERNDSAIRESLSQLGEIKDGDTFAPIAQIVDDVTKLLTK